MVWLSRHWKPIFAAGMILLLGGGIIAFGTSMGLIENRVNFEGELGVNFSTKTWNPFAPLELNEGDEATFYFDMRPNASLIEWGFFLYITNSTGQPIKTVSRGSAFGGATRIIQILFIAPYTDTYQIRAYASSAPPNSLRIYPSVSILKGGPNIIVLAFGATALTLGAILLFASILQKPKQVRLRS